jgi:hypothetical protein
MTGWLWNLAEYLPPLTWKTFVLGLVMFVVTFVGSIAVVSFLLVKLPEDYFSTHYDRDFWLDRHPVVRWSGVVVKNVLGALLVLLGLVMSLPGVPGQGVLTILLGVMLLDFPGKQRLERKIVSRPRVQHAINRLRARFRRPPLVLD